MGGSAGEQGCGQTPPHVSPWTADVPRKSTGRRAVGAAGMGRRCVSTPVTLRPTRGRGFRLWNNTVMSKLCMGPAGRHPSASGKPSSHPDANTTEALQPRCDPHFPPPPANTLQQPMENQLSCHFRPHGHTYRECEKRNRLPASLRAQRGQGSCQRPQRR